MPLVGAICLYDGSYQKFDDLIAAYEDPNNPRWSHAPVFVLKDMRDNAKHRAGAGVSASTLLSCPRAVALQESYEYYEEIISGYNKARGTYLHAVAESVTDPPPWLLREERIVRYVNVDGHEFRISGQFDEFNTRDGILVDYKSKDNLPRKPDPRHEAQFNIYAYLLSDGIFLETGERAQFEVKVIGAHYITWKTKAEKAWMKMAYPLWPLEETEQFIIERARPLLEWQQTRQLPACNPYEMSKYWTCDCVKLTDQLEDRGITVEEDQTGNPLLETKQE